MLVRDLTQPPSPEGTTIIKKLEASSPDEPLDGKVHNGVVPEELRERTRKAPIQLGQREIPGKGWINREVFEGEWKHR